ncbi:hypothetical protein BSKO_08585 [Bryopsis sp. KO-2023]|nr:hypothetical protein BSKO_08585 [Bryopsis sp. KO-2023]
MHSWRKLKRIVRPRSLGVTEQYGVELRELHFTNPVFRSGKMYSPKKQTELDLGAVVKGVGKTIHTRYGPVVVTCHGDPSCTPCVTYHDVGLNHSSCFQSLLVCSSNRPLLVENFCFYHIDAPGSEEGAFDVSPDILPMTMAKLSDQVLEVISYLGLREVVGMGVGSGGHVLVKAAATNPGAFAGLILSSPPCLKPGWWEWSMGKVALQRLKWGGMVDSVKDHVIARLLKSVGRSEDLANTLRIELSQRNPQGVHAYLSATLNREDLSDDLKKVTCRVLLLTGDQSIYRPDGLHMNTVIDRAHSAWVEIESAGCLATEEKPHELLSPIQLFLQALQMNGYGFSWDLH